MDPSKFLLEHGNYFFLFSIIPILVSFQCHRPSIFRNHCIRHYSFRQSWCSISSESVLCIYSSALLRRWNQPGQIRTVALLNSLISQLDNLLPTRKWKGSVGLMMAACWHFLASPGSTLRHIWRWRQWCSLQVQQLRFSACG